MAFPLISAALYHMFADNDKKELGIHL